MKENIKFKLAEGEKILNEIHHHPIIVAPHFIISFLILVFDFFLMYFLFQRGWWGPILFIAIILIIFFYTFRLLFLFYKNKLIVTNKRFVDLEQVNFFEKYTNEFDFEKIKEIKFEMKGVWAHIFRYGTLKVVIDQDVAPYELYKIGRIKDLQEKLTKIVFTQKETQQAEATDPVNLIMAEFTMLPREYKLRLYKEIRSRLRSENILRPKSSSPESKLLRGGNKE
jgi:hypothetical protein